MSTVRRAHLFVGLVALLALLLSGGLPGGIVALGLVQGALAALLALGLVLAYRTHRVVNLAHASMGLLSGVLTGMLVTRWHWSFWPAAVVGIALGAALGLLTERLVIARLAAAPRVVVLVATIGVAQIFGALQTALPLAFGGALPTYPVPGPSLDISPVHLGAAHLLTLGVVPVAIVALGWFLYRTRVGLGVLAVASDAERARGLGVPASALSALAWAVAGALAAVAGILTIPVLGYSLDGVPSATVLLLALAPAAVAGMRSLPVAALSALALGIAYQASLWFTDRASAADLMLGLVVLAALGTHRQLKGRTAAAMLASSWDVVARVRTTFAARPTPRTTATRVVGWLALAVAAVVVPNVLGPSNALLFGTAATFALAAAGVAVAWSLGGELSLGHWGLVAVGAAISAHVATWTTPLLGLVAAVGASTVAAVILGLAGRGRDSLGFAVAGLAAGVATPALLAQPGLRPPSLPADLGPGLSSSHGAAAIASLLAVAGVFLLGTLRRTRLGREMTAARDDPDRARALGLSPYKLRLLALAASGAAAGAAGAAYAFVQRVPAPEAFAGDRSLELVAMAAVGGLGSPGGAFLGAAAVRSAGWFLDGHWAMLGSGMGVLAVVLFLPGGLAAPLRAIQRRLTGASSPTAGGEPSISRPTWAGIALAAGALWVALGPGPGLVSDEFSLDAGPAVALGLVLLGLVSAWVASRLATGATGAVLLVAGLVGVAVVTGDRALAASAVPAGVATAAWAAGVFLTTGRRQDLVATAPDAAGAPPPQAALTIRGLVAGYDGHGVIQGVDLDVAAGEVVALVGSNGAGKSTLLRTVSGHVRPLRGSVTLNGEPVVSLAPESRVVRGLVLVPGDRPVFRDLTVDDNLRVAAYRSHPDRAAFVRATAAVRRLIPELEDRRGTLAGELSGGEQRLLAVAMALYSRPSVLLADELSIGLALEARTRVLALLRAIASAGTAVVVVDHDLDAVTTMADRVVLLEHGMVVRDGPPASFAHSGVLLPSVFLKGAR